ncbi:hypothetical protein RJ639_008906 [Escallonia herrerae]|uniref:Myb/SANT-like domain-containing protein n=1 Tax=Escallonia herrerae TaxID=1293975 RepID=A0AA88VUS8_9ASTE|nr:hypothetical protein RJ639_008906 [Escallonia herrerae]
MDWKRIAEEAPSFVNLENMINQKPILMTVKSLDLCICMFIQWAVFMQSKKKRYSLEEKQQDDREHILNHKAIMTSLRFRAKSAYVYSPKAVQIASASDLTKERRERKMGKRTRKEGETSDKSTNFRWSIPMDRLFLEILADEATEGNKPSNSFKPASFVRVAQAINQKFGCEFSPLHVENHLRTVKKTWSTISLLRGRSGYGWDATSNIIVCDK